MHGRLMRFKRLSGPVNTIEKLASALRVSEHLLIDVSRRSSGQNYRLAKAPKKKNGQERRVYSPSPEVRLIQRRVVNTFFRHRSVIQWPHFIFGGIHKDCLEPGESRDHVECARRHCGARSLLKVDIEDFFGSVTDAHVKDVLIKVLGWSPVVAELGAAICTKDGVLPQGGITSSYLSLLCLHDIEPQLVRELGYKNLVYTRYVDDLTISSKSASQDFTGIMKLVEQRLLSKGFTVNSGKVEHLSVGLQALAVHGLNVAFESPELPKAEIQRIRSVCRETTRDAAISGRRKFSYRKRYNRTMGLVNKLARVGNQSHRGLVEALRKAQPLASFRDYEIATDVAHEMRGEYSSKGSSFWYRRRFNRLMARLALIACQDKKWADTLRSYMRSHFAPLYKSER